jgi:tRNA (mo5U34)-methyltransferase
MIMWSRLTAKWQPQRPAPAPVGFNLDKLFKGYHWHQRWEVFQGVYTPGRNPVAMLCDLVGLPQDLRGKRVLDIGAFNGCFSFECERRGAAEVVALTVEPDKDVGFSQLKNAVGSRVVRYVEESVYNINDRNLGQFDLVLFLGVLYHLRYPLLAIDRIRSVCRGTVLVETHVCDDHFLLRDAAGGVSCPLGTLDKRLKDLPIWRFYKSDELCGDASNWFGPNIRAVIEGFETAGFAIQLLKQWGDRAAFAAQVNRRLDEAFETAYEANSGPNRRFLNL